MFETLLVHQLVSIFHYPKSNCQIIWKSCGYQSFDLDNYCVDESQQLGMISIEILSKLVITTEISTAVVYIGYTSICLQRELT